MGRIAAVDGSIVRCGCPTGSNKIIAPAHQWLGNGPSPEQVAAEKRAEERAAVALIQAEKDAAEKTRRSMPVFAKSAQRGPGNTEAGTDAEPHTNFGPSGYWIAVPDAVAESPAATNHSAPQHAQTAKKKKTTSDTEDTRPWYKRLFGGKPDDTSAPEAAAGGVAATVTKSATQLAMEDGELALMNFMGGGMTTVGTWLVSTAPMGAAVVGMFWSNKLNAGEQDFIDDMRLNQLATARGKADTRVRFRWDESSGRGEPKAYHVSEGGGLDKVPVRMLQKNHRSGAYEFTEDGESRPTLVWTPDTPGFIAPTHTGNGDRPYLPSSILVHPEGDIATLGTTESPASAERTFRDYILVHPEGTFKPIYIYLSKPPVKLLDVDLYSNLNGRPRQGMHADHMPSAAAVRAKMKRLYPDAKPAEIDRMAKDVAAIVIPADVHQKLSATYGGRNNPEQIEQDSRDLRAALERDIGAIRPALKERGVTDGQIDQAKAKMHKINQEQGLYDNDSKY